MLTTLRARLIASYIGVVLLCLLLAGGAFVLLLGRVQNRTIYRDLTSSSYLLLPQIRTAILTNERPRVVTVLATELTRTRLRVLVLTKDGTVVNDTLQGSNSLTGAIVTLQPNPPDASVPNGPTWGRFNDAHGARWYYVEMNLRGGAGGTLPAGVLGTTWLLVQQPPGVGEIWDTLGQELLLAGGLALGIALVLGYALARSVARPVDRLARAADEVTQGNYAAQVPVLGTSELRSLAERFNAMTAEVRKAHQMERDFLANVSHDLKTPLTAIQGFSQAILDGAVQGPGGTEQAARIINSEARRMSRMVADLLDLAKLESGQTPLERVPTDPLTVLHQAADTLLFQARDAQVRLLVEGGPLPSVLADPDRLRRALINLLDNALGHTPPGGTVTARGEAGPGVVILSVRDTGAGIPPDDLPHIFERFYQVDKSRSQTRSNSGLGLAIVQQIVQAHHGTLSVVSQVGVGTEFRIQLPVEPVPPPGDSRRITTALKLPILHR